MFAATLAAVLLAAPPEPPTYIEFDGKAGKNPTAPAPRTIAATGTFTLPPESDFIEVEVSIPLRTERELVHGRVLIATVDRSVKPHTWVARGENFEPGHYWVIARLHFADKIGKGVYETWDQRKVIVEAPPKK